MQCAGICSICSGMPFVGYRDLTGGLTGGGELERQSFIEVSSDSFDCSIMTSNRNVGESAFVLVKLSRWRPKNRAHDVPVGIPTCICLRRYQKAWAAL